MHGRRGGSLVDQDVRGESNRRLVLGPAGHPLQKLVGRDLQMLEGVGERDQLDWRIRLEPEEPAQVHAAEAEGRVLQGRRAGAPSLQPLFDQLPVELGLLEMVPEGVGQAAAARSKHPASRSAIACSSSRIMRAVIAVSPSPARPVSWPRRS